MSDRAPQVRWPAVIRYQGDDELLYCADERSWLAVAAAQHPAFSEMDRLIDSSGQIFRLLQQGGGLIHLQPDEQAIDLPAFNTLLRAHAVSLGNCCAGKVGCTGIEQGLAMIGQMEQD